MDTEQYLFEISGGIHECYAIAEEARKLNFDPQPHVEIPLALSLAEKVVGLISTIHPQVQDKRIVQRILDLEKEYGRLDPAVCLKIAEEVAKQKFCQFSSLIEAIEAGSRLGFAYITLGVVSSPIEGFTALKLFKNKEGKEYFAPYYSGPVRSAGGTGAAFSLVILDHLREVFGYAKYDPTEDEIKRAVIEVYDYHERITNLQYLPTKEEIELLVRFCPVQIAGEASEDKEVSNYKDLERIDTNFLRSGFCLTLAEGLAQKAAKILRYVTKLRERGFKLSDWDFLKDYIELHKKRDQGKTDSSPTYIKDLVAGRPVFGYPSRSGAFRFRYGRSRVSGFSAFSLHPATMKISDDFIALGTQLKIEKPTKGGVVSCCDSIEGPIVKLKSGSVLQLTTVEEAKHLYSDVEEIIYFGDILFPFSDLVNRNQELITPGYVEEWWALDLKQAAMQRQETISFDPLVIDINQAIQLSKNYSIPLHPKFIFYWSQISFEQFSALCSWIFSGRIDGKLILPYHRQNRGDLQNAKRALELLGVPHEVTTEDVVLSKDLSQALFLNLGLPFDLFDDVSSSLVKSLSPIIFSSDSVLQCVNSLSGLNIKDKAGSFIGTRMGRPEKSKLRKLTGSPHVLFPVGEEGGRMRSVQEAVQHGSVYSTFPLYYCINCSKESVYRMCVFCSQFCKQSYFSVESRSVIQTKPESKDAKFFSYSSRELDIKDYYLAAIKHLGLKEYELPPLIKGVRGTSSANHNIERMEKGILRSRFSLNVNKDGTIRFDCTEMPLTHFKPKEIFVEVSALVKLGYTHDIYGEILEREDQILELKPHDIVLPCCPESPDERADDVFIRISQFIDSLLTQFYKLPAYYNVQKKQDLVGQLAVCMAPHNCAGVIARIIGFSHTQGLLASPYMHAAMRRDCDGDEAAVMLLLDVLINFSRSFLPSHRGGTQDAPLVLNGKIDAGEVDDQILDFELVSEYPLELYQKAELHLHSSEVKIPMVKDRLKNGEDPFVNVCFTHNTTNFNDGVVCSSYKKLPTMQEKVAHQMGLVEKIRAVEARDVATLMLERHFIRDIRGNLRKFSMQQFRCVKCNEKFRRPPLAGVCNKCHGKIIFTISEGSVTKYLQPAMDLIIKYDVSPYIKQTVELTQRYIESVFGKENEKQEALKKWF